jgi:hypothetical protein
MNNHFAELGDVWKHLPLAEILRVNPPRVYWETHAGSASYVLTESPSRLHGPLRFLSLAPEDPDLEGCAYLAALTLVPGVYPGSATLATLALGRSASYVFVRWILEARLACDRLAQVSTCVLWIPTGWR